ncbi:hypothetical protein HRW12_00060 [Streptomyces lunaelactis]|uniref:hypothetical protein n=1 Tax=Streptomyces lunaelactis TaxID=1535768 RepID=UPI001585726B|nr:hypothetical protein [Streptomyces lunaelactis]NUK32190.1 hypothetical protein [Streptomyces lunaelactis]NUK44953.1 hypothetical protein [Streptomyces lunaelactis]
MQVMHIPGGDVVAVMEAKEVVLAEVALTRYVGGNPDSNLAVRMMQAFVTANEEAARRTEEAAEGGEVAASA